ncbi:hypothetical protein BDV97DRAFT_396755 [Delphinella strobiligena]|nr:hypothetical protein BDV97DRAFT_396755 [Delphinella strobiligena]
MSRNPETPRKIPRMLLELQSDTRVGAPTKRFIAQDITNLQEQSPLMSLPAEVRVMIYSYVLVAAESPFDQALPHHFDKTAAAQPSLLRTYRFARAEAIPMFCSKNDFVVAVTPNFYKHGLPASPWLSNAKVQNVKDIRTILFWTLLTDYSPTAERFSSVCFRVHLLDHAAGFEVEHKIFQRHGMHPRDDDYLVQPRLQALEWCLDGLVKSKVDCFNKAMIRKLKSKLVQPR